MKKNYFMILAALMMPTLMFAQPANDTCDGAIELVLDGPALTADNTDATIVGDLATCFPDQTAGDVWFMFTTTEVSNVALETVAGTSIDSQLSVWTIVDCGTGSEVYTEVACNDDIELNTPNYMSYIQMIGLEAGTYYVKAGTYDDTVIGDYTVALVSLGALAANDECSGAVVQEVEINGATSTVTGSATVAQDIAGWGENQVWEAFTITDCADVTLDMCGTTIDQANGFIQLSNTCPSTPAVAESVVAATAFDLTSCVGANITLSFIGLEAGTYYYPIMSSVGSQIIDDYTVNITAVTCGGEPDTCLVYSGGPYAYLNENGAPAPDENGVCTPVSSPFAAWASETYPVDGFVAGTTYTFSICDGDNAGAWESALSVVDENGVVVAYVEDCSVTWTAEMDGSYVLGISEVGHCYDSANLEVDAGIPTLTCEGTDGLFDADKLENITIYPNPSKGVFNVMNNGVADTYQIRVFDITGKQVVEEQVVLNNGGQYTIDLNDATNGIYTVQFVSSNNTGTLRVVKN